MKLMTSLACLVALTCLIRAEEEAGSKCVSADSTTIFNTKAIVVSDVGALTSYPSIDTDGEGKPIGLVWNSTQSLAASSEKIAEIGGKEIRRFVFWETDGKREGDGIVCVWIGYQVTAPSGGMAFRPFMVFDGDDQVRWWESYCGYNEQDGFTVTIRHTIKGNGIMWSTTIVGFQNGVPVPLRKESGGRGKDEPDVFQYR